MHRQSPEGAIAIACFTMGEAIIKTNVNQNGEHFRCCHCAAFCPFLSHPANTGSFRSERDA